MKKSFYSILFLLCCLPQAATAEIVTAKNIPWSGYWWPDYKGGLVTGNDYYGHPAPLERYDLLTTSHYPSTVSNWYTATYYDPSAPSWYGHCLAWSKAAMTEIYPILPSSEDNIIFRVGDKKALLTVSHQNDLYELGGAFAETFHLWLLTYIKDQATPFIADLDAGESKWYYPIYKYDMTSVTLGLTESVSVTVYYVSNFVHPDYIGTDSKTAHYTYNLQLDNDGSIISGSWTGNSIDDHPHLLFFPLGQKSDAPGLDYEKVLQLAKNKDDAFEQDGETATLAPGTYNLVLLNSDTYTIPAISTEDFTLSIQKLPGSTQSIEAILTDTKGVEVREQLSAPEESFTLQAMAVTSPPYTLSLSQQDYSDANLYSVTVDQRKGYVQHIPYLPKNRTWKGFAITNNSIDSVHNVMLTTGDAAGVPIQTIFGPLTLAPHEKKIFTLDSLPYRKHEFVKTSALTLQADHPVQFLHLIGNDSGMLASEVQNNSAANQIILPVTKAVNSASNMLLSYIVNNSLVDTVIHFRIFDEYGLLADETEQELAPHGILTIKPGSGVLGNLPENGWIEATSTSDTLISGYSYTLSQTKAEGIFALLSNSTTRYIPHVPMPGQWSSEITLINTGAIDNTIRLHPVFAGNNNEYDVQLVLAPYEKRTVSISRALGFYPGDSNYHSITEVTGTSDFAGFFSYQSDDNDRAEYPLLDSNDFKNTLTLPHYPGSSYWWTGVVVSNPQATATTIQLLPYNNQGELIDEVVEIDIPGGAYEVFTVSSLFSASTTNATSFISIQTDSPDKTIGGLYLYGTKDSNTGLSGSVM